MLLSVATRCTLWTELRDRGRFIYDVAIDMWSKLPDCVYKNSSITVIMQLNPCTLHQWQIVEIRSRGVDNIASVRICISERSPTALCFKVTVSKPQDNTTDTCTKPECGLKLKSLITSWWIHVWGLSKSTIGNWWQHGFKEIYTTAVYIHGQFDYQLIGNHQSHDNWSTPLLYSGSPWWPTGDGGRWLTG